MVIVGDHKEQDHIEYKRQQEIHQERMADRRVIPVKERAVYGVVIV